VEDVGQNSEAEAIRLAHISHETSIKGIGTLYYLAALIAILGTAAAVYSASRNKPTFVAMAAVLVLFGLLAAGFFAMGRGLRRLRPWVRVPTIVLAGLGMLGFPLGTLINGYIFWLVLSKKGQLILSPEYAAIVEATPDVKYRTPLHVWIILGLIVLVLLAVFIPLLSR
jgi:hypothetical protein